MNQKTPPSILLVDGHALAYRAYYALLDSRLQTRSGIPTNAIVGFFNMLMKIIDEEKPTYIAIAFDSGRKTFRTEKYSEYKAQRPPSPDEFRQQVKYIEKLLQALQIRIFRKKNYEADDVIATLVKKSNEQKINAIILTSDRDSFQLINKKTTVLYPKRGVSDIRIIDEKTLKSDYEVTPSEYIDFAALRGDKSDNLPSVPGVGEKTALKLIGQYKTIEDIIAHADGIPGRIGKAIAEHSASLLLNKELIKLVDSLPLDFSLPDLEVHRGDPKVTQDLCSQLELHSLLKRFNNYIDSVGEVKVEDDDQEFEIYAGKNLKTMLTKLSEERSIGVDVDDHCITFAGEKNTFVFPVKQLTQKDYESLQDWIVKRNKNNSGLCFHKAKSTIKKLSAMLLFPHIEFDIETAAYIYNPDRKQYEIENLSLTYLSKEISTDRGETLFDLDTSVYELSVQRAKATVKLSAILKEELEEINQLELVETMEFPLTDVLSKMESRGIAVDEKKFTALQEEFFKYVFDLEQDAYAIAGKEFMLGSPKQIQEILYTERKLQPQRKTKTGYSTDAQALAQLVATTDDPLPAAVLLWRDKVKLLQIIETLQSFISDDSRIYTTFNQTGTATGRISCQDPNLQTIPIRSSEGLRIREAFVVGDGYEYLLSADYNQIEMRIMAHLSDDQNLIDSFNSGEDVHSSVAAQVFGVDVAKVDSSMRSRVKGVSYGLSYGQEAYGLSLALGIGQSEAQELIDKYFVRFKGIKDYLYHVVEEAKIKGYTETIFGRRRYLPGLTSKNQRIQRATHRVALNAPIQGSAADIMKMAMLQINAKMQSIQSRMLLQIHDELIFEIAPGELDTVKKIIISEMKDVVSLRVGLDVSIGVGKTWKEAMH